MKQLNFFKPTSFKKEHGGSLDIGKRKCRRPLSTKTPMHLVLKSEKAVGPRALTRHRPLIERVISSAKKRFNVQVYEMAIVYNHIHLLIKGKTRSDLQNFFRVVAGHIAQEILQKHPLQPVPREAKNAMINLHSDPANSKSVRNENVFWMSRIYSRLVSWGNEYFSVRKYVIQNTLESLGLIPYQERKPKKRLILKT